ncbi:GtrA family protein [Weissella hellenica]|uniref:Flippase GtrA (Transmembrane translocase of bactoprenol-linked glucose) n=1 Tax=Weissella hellenica TaxID=46256 RepID=A0A4Y4G2C7_WEIHE|nr:GtrA family protein [Weissella hellenica]NKY66931.1 GtrA family protein [Weissella hellenica]GED35863.1 membrane protein [Weissella hellenica]SCB92020.1 Putative flippase GtrA (transmembrane translocase of bactoprenol-linked glucose) [Weissella hellenica]
MRTIMATIVKYRMQIMYLVFGVLTTLVNIVVYSGARWIDLTINISYVLAWLLSVLFAYLTNRKWVFDSQTTGFGNIILEVIKFFLARLATGVLGYLILLFGVHIIHQNDMIWNIIQNIFVIVSNYVLSKLVIFRLKEKIKNDD